MKNWKVRYGFYLVLSTAGFITAMIFNAQAVAAGEDYFAAWSASAANLVLTWDLGIVAIAGVALMFIEGRRIGMKRVWVYVLLSGFTAMACSFPLFLAMREKHLAKAK